MLLENNSMEALIYAQHWRSTKTVTCKLRWKGPIHIPHRSGIGWKVKRLLQPLGLIQNLDSLLRFLWSSHWSSRTFSHSAMYSVSSLQESRELSNQKCRKKVEQPSKHMASIIATSFEYFLGQIHFSQHQQNSHIHKMCVWVCVCKFDCSLDLRFSSATWEFS